MWQETEVEVDSRMHKCTKTTSSINHIHRPRIGNVCHRIRCMYSAKTLKSSQRRSHLATDSRCRQFCQQQFSFYPPATSNTRSENGNSAKFHTHHCFDSGALPHAQQHLFRCAVGRILVNIYLQLLVLGARCPRVNAWPNLGPWSALSMDLFVPKCDSHNHAQQEMIDV